MTEAALSFRAETGLTGPEVMDALRTLTVAVAKLEQRLSDEDGKVTILHKDALTIQRAIRDRAAQIADKYQLPAEGEKRIRAAIKRETLAMYGIQDLHDLPAKRLPACRMFISGWSSYSAVREARRT